MVLRRLISAIAGGGVVNSIPYMAKKTIYPGTQDRKNKVLKRPIDLAGINKVPVVG